MPERSAPSECANCGAAIPPGAKACPACGADERTGWRDASVYDGLDLPDEAFEATAKQSRRPPRTVNNLAWYWWTVAVGVLLIFGFVAIVWLRSLP